MRLALINDLHWGIRSASPIFIDYFNKFYDTVFFPYLKKNNIKTLIVGGDLVDSRKNINYLAADALHNHFLDPLVELGVDSHFIMGNHDQFFKGALKPNALDILFRNNFHKTYPFKFYEKAEEVIFDNLKMLLIPWICDGNREHNYDLIKSTDAQVVYAHLELIGFPFYKGIMAHEGESANVYKRFDMVFSGHYHEGSTKGNITYLGAPCQFTWADVDCDRGFHIFDTDTRELEFIKNPYNMFNIVDYDEDTPIDVTQYKDTILKVNIKNKKSQSKYDEFISSLDNSGLSDYNVIPENSQIVLDDSIPNIELESTNTIINHYVDELDDTIDKLALKTLMGDLYISGLNQLGKV